MAFCFIACDQHPDHDTLAHFRRRFGEQFEGIFLQVLGVARENPLSRFGAVSLDGTKIQASASRHSALSYEHASKIEAQLKEEVQLLLNMAEKADQDEIPDGMDIPEEIQRREDRLAAITEAKEKIEERDRERFEREKAEHQTKLEARKAKEEARGRKLGGKPPKPPEQGPAPKDQVNLTDEESRIMKVSDGGFDQCYNAQAAVDNESMLVMACDVTQAPNDVGQVVPMVEKLCELPGGLNPPGQLLADTGYFSEENVRACHEAGIDPLIAMGRDKHHPGVLGALKSRHRRGGR